ncbi:MAG: sigma-54-dependent Fis family transcriptional regulator [Magnetococcales bacterium]|nr:sigma-54-dependent Fis family transcriptional regulator [Magnetococcales bacterium]
MQHAILVVDDEEAIRTSLRGILEDESYRVVEASSGTEALQRLMEEDLSAILLDIWMEGLDGIETLRRIKALPEKPEEPRLAPNRVPVVMMSGHGTIDTAVAATKIGAYDFLEKPLSLDRVLLLMDRAVREADLIRENLTLRASLEVEQPMIGTTPIMQALEQQIKRVAPTNGWVLITGENGTGKEVAARRIHKLSARSAGPFIPVNAAAIPEKLIEAELFGSEESSGGRSEARRGRFELSHQGTLFLDEIGDMSLKTQSKILRILQEQRFERVGGRSQIQVDVRVIAASNKNLEEEIAEGRFRADLYYRLNVIPLRVPPLRDRKEDIPPLVSHFLGLHRGNQPTREFSEEAMALLTGYHWPGNVRELKNLVERLVIMAPNPVIRPEDLPDFVRGGPLPVGDTPWELLLQSDSLREAREIFEREYLKAQLERHAGNISRTAETIRMERSALHRKLKTLGLG